MATDDAGTIDKSPVMASASTPTVASTNTAATEANGDKHGFLKLPEELVSNVACKLGSDDLFSLRLTCRDLEVKSFHEFVHEYFGSKCFMFTTESLKVLVNIAKSPKLNHCLKKVYITTASATKRQVQCCQHGSCAWNPTVRQHEAFTEYKSDQERLQDQGGDLKLLSEAFSHLSHLTHLTLVDHPKQLPVSVECYGLRKFIRTTGISPSYRPVDASFANEYYPWLTHVFRTTMLAVAKSGINTITELHAHLNMNNPYGLSPTTDLRFKATTLDQLTKAFSNLVTVDLCFRSRALRAGKKDSQEELKVAGRSLKSFARVLKNVKRLTLAADVGQWSGPILKSLTNNIDLSKLTGFQLDGFLVNVNTLAAIVCQLSSAQMISFMMVEIDRGGSWVPILKVLEKLPSLNHLHMYYLQADGQKCFFLEKPDDEEEDLTEPSWLDQLTGDMIGNNDQDDESGWSDEDEDEEDEDGDDEEEDSLPDLLDHEGAALPEEAAQDAVDPPVPQPKGKKSVKTPAQSSSTKGNGSPSGCLERTDKNHRAPGVKTGERGYYICLEGDEIREQLPTFMKEYNLGGDTMGEVDFTNLLGNLAQMPAGAGGNIGGMFAMPLPMPAQLPAQGGGAQAPPAGGPNIPPIPTLGGILGLLGGPLPPPPPGQNPPGPGIPLASVVGSAGQAGNASAAATAATNGNTTNQQDDHEEGWWEDSEVVEGGGALDDVD